MIKTASSAYLKHIAQIMEEGRSETARGLNFLEVLGHTYEVPMYNPIITIPERSLGFKFAVAEPYWILSGNNRLSDIAPYGRMSPYSDDGYFMSGAYGPKITDQLRYVCKTLAEDQGSRQAVINIWRENPGQSKDIPCTLSLQFVIRKNQLHCMATMRSSDAWLGLPYDSIMFSMASAYVISILKHFYEVDNLMLGNLRMFLGSSHIYDRNFEDAEKVIKAWDFDTHPEVDFNRLARKDPGMFLELLESWTIDEDSSGILEIGGMK